MSTKAAADFYPQRIHCQFPLSSKVINRDFYKTYRRSASTSATRMRSLANLRPRFLAISG
ncbi:hypothetical protein [[Phormidium] sp. ETS-05]|uniref:hypothetical protein n=1 Tax=[Phormidium] sp. ETS-05 TaxID=222819 RepID=UPI0018EF1590|nr:hypothetical protein [[Phormidium] sp. ETS-05]